MGYIAHHAIIVTGEEEAVQIAREKAISLELCCSEIVRSWYNGYTSFLIAPDGSKEGWDTSNEQQARREEWIEWLRKSHDLYLSWALVRYGGDDPELAAVEDHDGNDA